MKKSDRILSIIIFRFQPIILIGVYINLLLNVKNDFTGGALSILGLILPLVAVCLWLFGNLIFKASE